MISRLPRWVWVGGWTLTIAAGLINAVALLGFEHTPASHLTATVSRIGIAMSGRDWGGLLWFGGIVGAFLAGAIVCGMLVRGEALEVSPHYAWALFIESGAIVAAWALLRRESVLGVHCLCFACGLQNSLVSTYSGAIIRTTHMTGLVTDLGVVLGRALRGRTLDARRLRLYLLLIGGFVIGGAVGALGFDRFGYHTLLLSAGLTGAAALGCASHRRWALPEQDV
jgi:uncharacterized membrane protein YoaK (UPF0700 family)